MANTKRITTRLTEQAKRSMEMGLLTQIQQLTERIVAYEKQTGRKFSQKIVSNNDNYDYINPNHYKQDDGKETWERMVDKFGLKETAIFCKLNAYKYRDRMGKKPNEDPEREQKKIDWYEKKAEELFFLHKKKKKLF